MSRAKKPAKNQPQYCPRCGHTLPPRDGPDPWSVNVWAFVGIVLFLVIGLPVLLIVVGRLLGYEM